jgi:hypothetical protein
MADTITYLEQLLRMTPDTLAGDSSGKGRDGTVNGATFDAALGAYVFGGDTDRINAGSYSMGSAWTIACRILWDGTESAALCLFAKLDTFVAANMVAQIVITTSGTKTITINTNTSSAPVVWPGLTQDVEYDLAVTYSGGFVTIYIDGVALGSPVAFTPGTDQTAAVVWGSQGASGGFGWTGNIYWGAVWSRALTAAQILELVDSEPAVPVVGALLRRDLIAYWPFDDVAGTTHSIFDHYGSRHLVNTGLDVGSDWLEGTGSGYALTNYMFMDDLTSGLPFTVALEAYFPTLSSTDVPLAAAWNDDATSDRSWALLADSSAAIALYSTTGANSATLSTAEAPVAGSWQRLLIAWDGSTVRVGLNNGTTISQNSAAAVIAAPYIDFYIGSYHDGSARQYAADGVRIRNVRAWRRGLSEVERLEVLGNDWAPDRMETGDIDVALLIGQSNQIGHEVHSVNVGSTNGTLPYPQNTYFGLTFDVWVYEKNQSPTGFRRAFPRDGENETYLGPQTGAAAYLGSGWAIINMAVGGSGIDATLNQWQPDDLFYTQAQTAYAAAISSLVAAGFNPKLRVIDIHFGETDGNTSEDVANRYQANLTEMIADLRTDFGDVPVVLSRVSINQTTIEWIEIVRAAVESVASSVDRVTMLDLDPYQLVAEDEDWVHFTNQAQWEIGKLKAKTWLSVTEETSSDSAVSPDVISPKRTWYGVGYRAQNIVELARPFEGALALKPDLNPGTTISSVDSVTITGVANVTATELTVNRDRTTAHFTVPTLTTVGTYSVTVTVTTVDGQTITTTGTLKVY